MSPSENIHQKNNTFLTAKPTQGNSSQVTSNQPTIHPDLEKLVRKYQQSRYLRQINKNRELDNLILFLNKVYKQLPIVLDSGCGTGDSSITLARMFPDKFIVGLDKSIHRLSKIKQVLPSNLLITQQKCEDIWSSLADNNIKCDTFLLYQNPWPKKKHIKRRWHAHPAFPSLLHISNSITMRTNWRIYALEFSVALVTHNIHHRLTPLPPTPHYLSPFERKYTQSGHTIYEVTTPI